MLNTSIKWLNIRISFFDKSFLNQRITFCFVHLKNICSENRNQLIPFLQNARTIHIEKKKKNLISLPFKSHESQTQTFEGYCESAEPRKNSIPSSDHPITIYIHRGTKGIAIETKKQNTIFAKLNPHFVAIRRPVAPCYPHPTYLYIYCPFNSLKILRFHGGTIAGEQLGGSGGMKANKCKQKENAGSTMAFDFIGPPLDACYTPGNRTRFSIPPPSIIPTVCVSAFYEPPLSPRPCSKTETRFED